MERRVAPLAALFVVLSVAGAVFAAPTDPTPVALAAVGWPVSTLLVSEVQTGGASASDEFAEITNVGPSTVDLAGLEIVYVTSTGSTVTRKASWSTPTLLGSGRHSVHREHLGHLRGTRRCHLQRRLRCDRRLDRPARDRWCPIDALGWGDATNTFVEGSPATAPAAGSSIERKPGGLDGNTTDTNANATDWFGQASPNPQALSAPPVPAPGTRPDADPRRRPHPIAGQARRRRRPQCRPWFRAIDAGGDRGRIPDAPTDRPRATPPRPTQRRARPGDTHDHLRRRIVEPTPVPTPSPSLVPTDTPAPSPTPAPTATPAAPITIASAEARSQPNGTTASITGVLRRGSGPSSWPQGVHPGRHRRHRAVSRCGARRLPACRHADPGIRHRRRSICPADAPGPARGHRRARRRTAAGAGHRSRPERSEKPIEGSRVEVSGVTIGSPTEIRGRAGHLVDDGTGRRPRHHRARRARRASLPAGTLRDGHRASGSARQLGDGAAGYRIHPPSRARSIGPPAADAVAPRRRHCDRSPSPTPTPSPTAEPTACRPQPAPSSAPTPRRHRRSNPRRPTSTAAPARRHGRHHRDPRRPTTDRREERDRRRRHHGRSGAPWDPVADGHPGLDRRDRREGSPDGIAAPIRGIGVIVTGPIADPYGQLEIRPAAGGIRLTGLGTLPSPADVVATELGEGSEGILVDVVGVASRPPSKGTSGDLSYDFADAAGHAFRVMADGSSIVVATIVPIGRQLRITGVAGQRASRKGVLDGYPDLDPRSRGRRRRMPPLAGPTPSGAPTISIAAALAKADGAPVVIEATVTAGTSLLDSSGRRIVLQDGTGAIEVLLPVRSAGPAAVP